MNNKITVSKIIAMLSCILPLLTFGHEKDLGKGSTPVFFHIHYPPDPINTRNGNFYLPIPDHYLSCFNLPLEIYRSYNSLSRRKSLFGIGWIFNYDVEIVSDSKRGFYVIEPDGYFNEYKPLESKNEKQEDLIAKIVEEKTKEDVKYTGRLEGKGTEFYANYQKQLEQEPDFFQRQKSRYLPPPVLVSPSGKYVSYARGTTYLTKTSSGFTRTFEMGRKEEFDSKGLLTKISDRNDNALTLTYNSEDKLSKITDSCGRFLSISFNKQNTISKIGDSLNRTLSYEYDKSGHLISSTSFDGNTMTFAYDASDHMTSIVFPDKTKTEIVYDKKSDRVIKQSGPGTKITQYEYGKAKDTQWIKITDNEGLKNTYEFLDAENKIVFQDTNGEKTITIVSASCGKPLSIKDQKGKGDQFEYDSEHRLVSKTDAAGQKTTYKYDPRFAQLISEIFNHDKSFIKFLYDQKGNVSFIKNSAKEYVKITYERHGKIETMVDHRDVMIRFAYNAFGKPTLIEKSVKQKNAGAMKITYNKMDEVLEVTYEPKDVQVVQDIKNTLNTFLTLLKPAGIDFEI